MFRACGWFNSGLFACVFLSRTRIQAIAWRAAVLCVVSFATTSVVAQATDTTQINAYLKAITQSDTTARLSALEQFAGAAPASNLRLDALEWIVWDEKQTHNDAAAATWAKELLKADPGNSLGMAVELEHSPSSAQAPNHPPKHDGTIDPLQQVFNNLSRLRRPEGMSFAEFTRLRQFVQGAVGTKAGLEALERKEYARARTLLSQAVAASPNDSKVVYSLALADLSGDKPNRQQGYWLLARAVNLSGGPTVARDIEQFGRKKYKEDGGSDHDWEKFLWVTAAPGANAATVVAPTEVWHGSSTLVSTTRQTSSAAVQPQKQPKQEKQTQVASNRQPPRSSKTGWKGEPEPPAESTAAANSLPPISGSAPQARTGSPVSLGILIETSMAAKGARKSIVNSLSDLVRRLGKDDEAFILSFSNDLVFEEDLTGDASRLETALDQIKPHPGTALLDAAGFAAGHLRRIAKNDTRVLLVISDGRNASSRIPALASSNEIRASGVKIYCIGVDVENSDSIYRLQGLATGTGGTAAFITAPDQFRAATQQIAGNMGIRFDY